jgi:hypothetical protein
VSWWRKDREPTEIEFLEMWQGGQMHVLVPLSVTEVQQEMGVVMLTVPCDQHGCDVVAVARETQN